MFVVLMFIYYLMVGQFFEKLKVGIYYVFIGKLVYIFLKGQLDDYLINLSWMLDEKYVVIVELNCDQDYMWFNVYDV